MREPVSISAVATMVSAPASSVWRAAAKILRGISSARELMPPLMVLPLEPTLKARPRRVMESMRMKTSRPLSTRRLAALDDESRKADVTGVFLIVRGGPEFAAPGEELAEIGHFLRAFVDEDDHEEGLGMIGQHRVGDSLHEHGLAGAGRGDDKTALAVANGGHQIHDAGGEFVGAGLEFDPAVRIDGGQFLEG